MAINTSFPNDPVYLPDGDFCLCYSLGFRKSEPANLVCSFFTSINISAMQTHYLCSVLTKKNIPVLKPPISGIPMWLSVKLQLSFYIRLSKAFGKFGISNECFSSCFGLERVGQYRGFISSCCCCSESCTMSNMSSLP